MSSEQQPTETPATGAPLGDRISKPDEAPKQPDTAQKEEPETAEKGSDAPQEKSDAAPSSGTTSIQRVSRLQHRAPQVTNGVTAS